MSDTVAACPECDTTSAIYTRDDDPRRTYRCRECGAIFEEPNRRAPRSNTNTQNGLAGKLAKADPDEVLGE